MKRYAATPLIVTLSPGHSDITGFLPLPPIAPDRKSFGSCRRNYKIAQMTGTVDVFDSRSGISGPASRSFRKSKSSWMMGPARSREMPSCSAIDLSEIRRYSKISL